MGIVELTEETRAGVEDPGANKRLLYFDENHRLIERGADGIDHELPRKFAELDDVDWATFANGEAPIYDSVAGKFKGLVPAMPGDLSSYVPLTQRGANNGVATLDSSGRLPSSQLTVAAMEIQGSWNAATNTPTLVDGTGNVGDFYLVTTGGSHDFGHGSIAFASGSTVFYGADLRWHNGGSVLSTTIIMPTSFDLMPQVATSSTNWSAVNYPGGNVITNAVLESTGAQNAFLSYDVAMDAGTWTIGVISAKPLDSAGGIITVSLDGTTIGTIDQWQSGFTPTYSFITLFTGITVAAAAKMAFKVQMATKNPSASSYKGSVQMFSFRKTA